MLMPAGRVVGDDGVYVSARQICEDTGIDLELLEAMQRALGLPAGRRSRRAGSSAGRRRGRRAGTDVRRCGLHPRAGDRRGARARARDGAGRRGDAPSRAGGGDRAGRHGAADRQGLWRTGATGFAAARTAWPRACCGCSCAMGWRPRRSASPSGRPGKLPGAREVTVCFADLVDFTRLGEAVPPEELENLANRLSGTGPRRRVAARALHQDDRRRGDVRQHRRGRVAARPRSSCWPPRRRRTYRSCVSGWPRAARCAGPATGSAAR